MYTLHPYAQPLVPDKIPSQESPLSPEWTHAITILIQFPPEMVENWWRYGGEVVTK